jgi:MFS superfamily sulfate permease-like transporter
MAKLEESPSPRFGISGLRPLRIALYQLSETLTHLASWLELTAHKQLVEINNYFVSDPLHNGQARRVAISEIWYYIDLAGSRMLHLLHGELASRGIALRIVGAGGRVRDLLRADGIDEKVGGLDRLLTLDDLLDSIRT